MEGRLLEAAQKGNIDELNDLTRSNALILEETALEGAGHTLLHVACVAGHLDFVRELLKLMPRFAEKVDADGFSPLHIAAARGDVEIVRELLRVGQHLCSVKGRERRIPLYYAVANGELHVMKLLLSAAPESIQETTAREETALHVAVKHNRFEAVDVLVKHLKQHKKEQVINWKDHKGNTVLHLATAAKNFEVVKFLVRGHGLEYVTVEVNALNESCLTPLDVLTVSQREAGDREIREILVRAGAKHGRGSSKSLADIRNALLVVAALIASATYQAVLQPPHYNVKVADNSKIGLFGYDHFGRASTYIVFMSFNTFGFLVSVQTIICLTRDLPVKLPLLLSTCSIVLTYAAYMAYVPFTSMDKAFTMKNITLFSMLPMMISTLLLLTQRRWGLFLDSGLNALSQWNIVGDMYNLGANPD